GPEAVAFSDARLFKIDQARFAAGDHQAIVGDEITHRPESVAIEFHADGEAIAENHGRGAIPGLALARKNFERAANVGGEERIFGEGRGNQFKHRGFDRFSGEELQFEGIVEACRIAYVPFEHGKPFADADAFANFALAGAQPAAIADDGIDFAIVSDVTERLSELPGRL